MLPDIGTSDQFVGQHSPSGRFSTPQRLSLAPEILSSFCDPMRSMIFRTLRRFYDQAVAAMEPAKKGFRGNAGVLPHKAWHNGGYLQHFNEVGNGAICPFRLVKPNPVYAGLATYLVKWPWVESCLRKKGCGRDARAPEGRPGRSEAHRAGPIETLARVGSHFIRRLAFKLIVEKGTGAGVGAWRSCAGSCSYRVRLTLRSRRETCNRSRDAVAVLHCPASLAAIRRDRRNASDSHTFQRRANASSNRTDSRSSESVDWLILVAMNIA